MKKTSKRRTRLSVRSETVRFLGSHKLSRAVGALGQCDDMSYTVNSWVVCGCGETGCTNSAEISY